MASAAELGKCAEGPSKAQRAQGKRLENSKVFHGVLLDLISRCANAESSDLDTGVYKMPEYYHEPILEFRRKFSEVFLEKLIESDIPSVDFLYKLEYAYDATANAFEDDVEGDIEESYGGAVSFDEYTAFLNLARYDILLKMSRALRYKSGRGVLNRRYWRIEFEYLESYIEKTRVVSAMGMCQGAWQDP